ncbi:MFP1 attachment factor 1-like [Rhodamnia argentea]|uniref:MFP1 attachment factor 1-like n=1 Tax=Rhodamnia argentea TaxID=178133 RepID=A0A8B8N2S0_9MYRT|nr:MFP1 attachment factor 1-like [Rhodamnia argentea]
MSESGEARRSTPPPPPPPQRTEAPPQQPDPDVSYRIWPPTQPTREAIVSRLVKKLSSPSALSPRYDAMPVDEAMSVARAIEQAAFDSTGAAASADDDGADVLQAYATSIGRRMLDSVQPRTRPASLAIDVEKL